MWLFYFSLVVICWSREYTRENFEYWETRGEERLRQLLEEKESVTRPKNVIFFLGDGMGLPVVTAHRIYRAQREGSKDIGKNHVFEDFPTGGMVKTYSHNYQVTDSAAGAVALFAGQKVDEENLLTKPGSSQECREGSESHINNGIAELAIDAGLSVGFVTTTRITHATPAALYAKGVNRSMESDIGTRNTNCTDIAMQLLNHPANKFKVLMGGGMAKLYPNDIGGERTDGRDIRKEWEKEGGRRVFVESVRQLEEVNAAEVDHLLGTFSHDDFPFYLDQKLAGNSTVPRLKDMTKKAIEILSKQPNGYFLMVEGGLIDHGEHKNQMNIAFEEMREFEEAIKEALSLTSSSDTLIVVTADHSHALSIVGYMPAHIDIMDTAVPYFVKDILSESPRVMPGLFFAAGPGYKTNADYTPDKRDDPHFTSPSHYALNQGVHGGEDVGVWATGPGHSVFRGTMENTQIAYNLKYLMCLMDVSVCKESTGASSSNDISIIIILSACLSLSLIVIVFLVWFMLNSKKTKRGDDRVYPEERIEKTDRREMMESEEEVKKTDKEENTDTIEKEKNGVPREHSYSLESVLNREDGEKTEDDKMQHIVDSEKDDVKRDSVQIGENGGTAEKKEPTEA